MEHLGSESICFCNSASYGCVCCVSKNYPLVKTNMAMAMEHGPNFEDVFPMENGDVPLLC